METPNMKRVVKHSGQRNMRGMHKDSVDMMGSVPRSAPIKSKSIMHKGMGGDFFSAGKKAPMARPIRNSQ